MQDTTDTPDGTVSPSPDDELRQLFAHVVSAGGLLDPNRAPHEHAGVHVSTSEVFALGELADAGTLSQHELGVRLGLEKSTVSRLAAGLQQRGWLIRTREPEDRRLYRLNLTDEGQHVAGRIGEELRSQHARLLSRLTVREREGLRIGLTGLIRELRAHQRHRP